MRSLSHLVDAFGVWLVHASVRLIRHLRSLSFVSPCRPAAKRHRVVPNRQAVHPRLPENARETRVAARDPVEVSTHRCP